MKVHRVFRFAPLAILLGAFLPIAGFDGSARAVPPAANSLAEARQNPIDLFAAEDAGEIEIGLVPRDEKRVTLMVTNKGNQPLAIRIPEAFAGAPVLAQIGGPIGANPVGNGRAPQALGVGGPGGGQQPFGLNGGQNGFPGGIMNVPPGKTVKVRLPAVCLEYGKPTPYPHSPYKAVRLESVTSDAGVQKVLASLGSGASDQRIAQLAAWHLANGKSWDSLAAMYVAKLNGRKIPEYSEDELAAAKGLVEKSTGKKQPAATASAAK